MKPFRLYDFMIAPGRLIITGLLFIFSCLNKKVRDKMQTDDDVEKMFDQVWSYMIIIAAGFWLLLVILIGGKFK